MSEWSETEPATPDIQDMIDELKPELERLSGTSFDHLHAVSYRMKHGSDAHTYLIKAHAPPNEFIHISLSLHGSHREVAPPQTGKTEDDPLEPY
ncbi:cystatin-A [Xenopus laevis]|uniref:Uncharacterized protein n=2 Tax=Xenopus laevis TaxID=8355 RepID=A0A974HX67_XENLA|nr:cystatin-A [Xenopus laevis]OCT93619.1 hypothetical protein XELAEV_18011294mg [Xenopus laevis]